MWLGGRLVGRPPVSRQTKIRYKDENRQGSSFPSPVIRLKRDISLEALGGMSTAGARKNTGKKTSATRAFIYREGVSRKKRSVAAGGREMMEVSPELEN